MSLLPQGSLIWDLSYKVYATIYSEGRNSQMTCKPCAKPMTQQLLSSDIQRKLLEDTINPSLDVVPSWMGNSGHTPSQSKFVVLIIKREDNISSVLGFYNHIETVSSKATTKAAHS